METKNSILIYESHDGSKKIDVNLQNNTIWLTQKQMAEIFEKDSDTIGLHIKNIYKTNELQREITTEKYSVVQLEGTRHVKRKLNFYNLDVIISVGYRVNSKKGTQFRIWANNVIKDHLVKGYSENKNRLNQLKKTVQLVTRTIESTEENSKDLISVLDDYTKALDILDDYDHQRIVKAKVSSKANFKIKYEDAINAIEQLRKKFGASDLFGNQKDDSFKSSIATIEQTFNGKELYTSIEEKAANLLYLVVKNHSFTDGNKRIAAWLFVWYLNQNKHLTNLKGNKKISNSTLVALTLMIAKSNPKEKDILINIIINLMYTDND